MAKAMWMAALAASAVQFAYGDATAVAPFARFCDGMLSRTAPAGWLRKACETQAAGLTGHQEAMSYPYDSCHWAGVFPRKGEHGEEWWRYEQTAYYVDGLLRLGYALGDAALTAKGERNVDYVLDHASPEGDLGDPCLWLGASVACSSVAGFERSSGYEMWAMAVSFRAMK